MRTIQEILDAMSPELRKSAMQAVDESHLFAATLASIPSPSALNGKIDESYNILDVGIAFA